MSSVRAVIDILNELISTTPNHVERFKMNGTEYGFVPDLDELTLGEYVDLDNNISNWDNMHIAMNVLYRPVKNSQGRRYNIVEYSVDNENKMKDMPLDAAIGSIFFFYNLGIELSRHTILYSNNQQEMKDIHHQLTSQGSGVGINQFMDSLTEILQDLKISLN